jgi:hypothetical protein
VTSDHWDDELDPYPVPLPDGGELVTLRDAGDFIAKLPKREQSKPEWQSATRDLLRAAKGHGPWRFLARLGIMHALYGKAEPPIGNPEGAPPTPRWRGRVKRDPWRG